MAIVEKLGKSDAAGNTLIIKNNQEAQKGRQGVRTNRVAGKEVDFEREPGTLPTSRELFRRISSCENATEISSLATVAGPLMLPDNTSSAPA